MCASRIINALNLRGKQDESQKITLFGHSSESVILKIFGSTVMCVFLYEAEISFMHCGVILNASAVVDSEGKASWPVYKHPMMQQLQSRIEIAIE